MLKRELNVLNLAFTVLTLTPQILSRVFITFALKAQFYEKGSSALTVSNAYGPSRSDLEY